MTSQPEDRPPLPPQAAFLVQFQADTDVERQKVAGRVEHVVSGQSTYFTSLNELLAFIGSILKTIPPEQS